MTDFLPCPFCGSTNLYYEHERPQGYICCSECGAEGPCDEQAADSICDDKTGRVAWNRRAALEGAPGGAELTDEELLKAWDTVEYEALSHSDVVQNLRDVIAADRARWGNHPGSPDSSGNLKAGLTRSPADEEVAELVAWLQAEAEDAMGNDALNSADYFTRAADLLERLSPPQPVAIPGEEYHEDMGPVTWWRLPVNEPPWVGTPNDSDWPGHHTHFTPAPPVPVNAHALPLPGEVTQ